MGIEVDVGPLEGLSSNIMDDRWLSVDESAEYLGVSKDTSYTWVTGKDMPGHKVDRLWKFKKVDVDKWIRAGGAGADERVEEIK